VWLTSGLQPVGCRDEAWLQKGRSGSAAMRRYVKSWPDRIWAVEGANGAGRPVAQRLLESGEQVVNIPAKLAARVRLFDTGNNRKTDAHDAHSIAVVAVRTARLRVLQVDGELEALRMLTDRRAKRARKGRSRPFAMRRSGVRIPSAPLMNRA
jgi:transposase